MKHGTKSLDSRIVSRRPPRTLHPRRSPPCIMGTAPLPISVVFAVNTARLPAFHPTAHHELSRYSGSPASLSDAYTNHFEQIVNTNRRWYLPRQQEKPRLHSVTDEGDGNRPGSMGPAAVVGAGGFQRDLMMTRRSRLRHQNEHICASSGAYDERKYTGPCEKPTRDIPVRRNGAPGPDASLQTRYGTLPFRLQTYGPISYMKKVKNHA